MSDSAITKDCLVHYDSRHIQLRRDYFGLCVYDKSKFNQQITKNGKRVKDEPNQECMAMILRLLETLTDDKRKEWFMKANDAKQKGLQPPSEPKETFIALTYGSICHLLYDTHCESTVRNSVAELLARKFIKRRQKTNNSIPEYALNIEVLQAALNKQAEDVLNGVSKSTAITKVRRKKSGVEIDSQATAFDSQTGAFDSQATAFDTNNKYSNKGDNKPSEKEENAHVSDDNAPTPSLSESNSPSSLQALPSETATLPLTDESAPLTEETAPSEPALPEIEAQREGEQTSKQAESPIANDDTDSSSGKGKGKGEKISQDRINHVYGVLENLFRKAYDSPEYCIPRTKTTTDYIKSLIKAKATPALVQEAFKKLWDQEDKNGDHWWREPGRLTIKAFVNQYTALAPSLMSASQNNGSTPPAQEEPEQKSVLGVAGLPRVETNKPAPKVSYVPSSVQQQRQRMLGKRIS